MHRFSYRTRGQRIAGYVFLGLAAACAGVSVAAPWLLPDADPGGRIAIRIVLGLGGTAFLLTGLVVAFKDRVAVVDSPNRELGIGWSWFRWRRMKTYAVDADAAIHLDALEFGAGNTTTTHYPVTVLHGEGEAEVVRGTDYRLSRRRAEALARLLGLTLIDTTSGSRVVRGPGDLDRSAADPATLPAGLTWPHLPKGTRLKARHERDTLRVSIPPPGFGGITLFALLLLGFSGVLAWGLAVLIASGLHPALVILIGLLDGALALLFAYAGYQGLADTLWRTRRLAVSPRGIRMPGRDGDRDGTLLDAALVEEIDLAEGAQGVIARTDEADVELGSYLSAEEAACLRDMVHLSLAGQAGDGAG